MPKFLFFVGLLLGGIVSCDKPALSPPPAAPKKIVRIDRADFPLRAASPTERERFAEGDGLFEATFRAVDGLGPLFIRSSCSGCHKADGRGPGLVGRMAYLPSSPGAPSMEKLLPFGSVERTSLAAGARTGIRPPTGNPHVRITYRLPPAVFGRGYVEAVADEEILRLEREARSRKDGIRGRIHWVSYQSDPNPETKVHKLARGSGRIIGRFGLKARIATLDEFTADALQGDMGLTSPMRPRELPNPDGLLDDDKPGLDVTLNQVNALSDYMRLIELPGRPVDGDDGAAVFAQALCATCHVPSLKTRADYPIAALAGIAAPIYSDLLLHDMGPALADGVPDGDAGSREWKTPPLIGLRFEAAYMHDGRARTLEAAILAHGDGESEAAPSVQRFRTLPAPDKERLLRFVSGL